MKTKQISYYITCYLFLISLTACTSSKVIAANNKIKIISNNKQNEFLELGNGWFQVTESVSIENITPESAKEIAIQKACKRAIEFYSGIEISGRSLNIQAENQDKVVIDDFSSITQQTARGIIIKKELLKEELSSNGIQFFKTVTIKVKVDKQKGEKDPSFQVTANLNREYFRNNEEMEISAKSTKDCFLTILNICSNDSVYVLFPNKYRKDNFVRSGELFQLPNSSDRNIGLCFPVNLLPNKNNDLEMLKVIATKQKIDFSSVYSFSSYGTYQSALNDLQNWLLRIPRDEIEEVDLQYLIGK